MGAKARIPVVAAKKSGAEALDPNLSALTSEEREAKRKSAGERFADWVLEDMLEDPVDEDTPSRRNTPT